MVVEMLNTFPSDNTARSTRPPCARSCFLGLLIAVVGAHFAAAEERPYVKAMFSQPLTSDPAQMNDGPSLVLATLMYDGLLSFSSDLAIQSALAQSWTIEDQGKRLIFTLRKDAVFHDGTPVTAEAVVSSLRRLLRPESKVSSYYTCIAGAEDYQHGRSTKVSGLRVKSRDVVEIELQYPFPPFLSVLAGATAKILPPSAETNPRFFSHPIGSGAFRLVSGGAIHPSKDIILEAFPRYYGEQPKVRRLILRQMNGDKALEAAEKGQVDDLANFYLNGDEKAFQHGRHLYAPVAATWIIGLNTRLKPFDRLEFRKSFKDAIDAEDFRKRFYSSAIPANGYIPPGMPGFQWAYQSVEAARGGKAPPDLNGQKIRIAVPMDIPKSKDIAEYLQARLRAKGFDIETVLMKWDDLMKGYAEKTLQAFLVSMNIDYPDTEFLVRNFESTNPDNFSGLRDGEIDALIRKARATPDKVLRQAYYVELARKLNDKAVTVNLLYPQGHYWVHRCVNGFEPNPLSDVYVDYRRVSIDERCMAGASAGL